jgi:hypothetical protein
MSFLPSFLDKQKGRIKKEKILMETKAPTHYSYSTLPKETNKKESGKEPS